MTDIQILLAWYRYAASAPGFIGAALRIQRDKASLTEQQQRASLGIMDSQYDHFWLRLQAMLLPRQQFFSTDLERIITYLSHELDIQVPIHLENLSQFIRSGLPEVPSALYAPNCQMDRQPGD